MSRFEVRSSTTCCGPPLGEIARLGSSLAATTLGTTLELVERASGLLCGTVLPRLPLFRLGPSAGCCEIPEQPCPPRCPCEIAWEASPGERLVSRIRVSNTSNETRTLQFSATPFEGGPEAPLTQLEVAPGSAVLAPGQTISVRAELAVREDFVPGNRYHAEVLIRSDHEQCVKITLWVGCREEACCEVEHGERPVRIRAHRWSDHFQCVEPCPPHHRTVPPPPTPDPSVSVP